MVAPVIKKTRKTNDNKPYRKTIKEKLTDNPQPIKIPNSNISQKVGNINNINVRENKINKSEDEIPEIEMNEDNNSFNEMPTKQTEALEHLDVAIINEPTIEKAKRNNRKERAKEIIELAKEIELPSQKKEKSEENKTSKKLPISGEQVKYDISKDVGEKFANITIGQLLELSPKLKTELSKALKFTKIIEDDSTILSTIGKDKVVKTKGKVEGIETTIYLDSCSSINMITKKFIEENNIQLKPVSKIKETFYQAFSNTTTISQLYEVEITIGDISSIEIFRLVEKEDIFQVLIGVETLAEMKLIMDFSDHTLYQKTDKIKKIGLFETVYQNDSTDLKEFEDEINQDALVYYLTDMEKKYEDLPNSKNNKKEILIENIINEAEENARNILKDLLMNNIEILAIDTDDLGKSKLLCHKIILSQDGPIKQKMYRISNKEQMDILKKEIKKLKENKLIEPSQSSWSSPVLLVPKKNGKWRMCVDYRKLNAITIKDSYPLPYIEEILFSIGNNVKYLSTLDLFSGFHQIPMSEEDVEKTCFTTIFGNYNYKVMPFGLCNAPATFQREMNRIFLPLIGKCMFVYMDDLVVFSPSLEQHIEDLQNVFNIIKENGIKANLSKCHFLKKEVEVLGHVLSTEGVKPVSKKVEAIAKWEAPTNITQLRSFLGAIGYYRKFIKDFAKLAHPLFRLLKKNVKFEWTTTTEERFQLLKERLIKFPILKYPDYDKGFIIRTDASLEGIGGVLLQKNEDNIEHPIHFVSRSLNESEINYSITDLEGTAAFYCCNKFKSYINGNKEETILYTDHKPLVGLFNNREPNNARQSRWVTTLSMLKVVVKYEQGKKNVVADALSRLLPSDDNNKNISLMTINYNETSFKNNNFSYNNLNKNSNKNYDLNKNFVANKNLNFSENDLNKNFVINKNLNFSENDLNKNFDNNLNKNSNYFDIDLNKDSNINLNKNSDKNSNIDLNKNSNKNSNIDSNKIFDIDLNENSNYSDINLNKNSNINSNKNFDFDSNKNFNFSDNNLNRNSIKGFDPDKNFATNKNLNSSEINLNINSDFDLNKNFYINSNRNLKFFDACDNILSKDSSTNAYFNSFHSPNLSDISNIFNDNKIFNSSSNNRSLIDSLPSDNLNTTELDNIQNINLHSNVILSTANDSVPNDSYPGSNIINEFLKKRIVTIDGVKYFKDDDSIRKIIENKEEKIELLLAAHAIGHEGFYKTYNRLKRKYYWKNMSKDVELLVKTCHDCQLKRPQPVNSGTESFATQPGLPFTRVGLDIIGPLPITNNNNRYIIVLVDYFTKWVEAEPLSSIESSDVIKFLTNVFARHGIPEILITDNGPQFTSDATKGFLDLYGVYVQFTSTYHPESNGQVENRNREIVKNIRLLGNSNKDWDEVLPAALWALRTCKNEVTKFSSFELLYGRTDLQPFELNINYNDKNLYQSETEYLINKFVTHWEWIIEVTKNIKNANKLWENRRKQKNSMKTTFTPGDLVLVRNFSRRKLDPFFMGPFKIIKMELNTATLCDPISGIIADRNVHKKNLVHYHTWNDETSGDEVQS